MSAEHRVGEQLVELRVGVPADQRLRDRVEVRTRVEPVRERGVREVEGRRPARGVDLIADEEPGVSPDSDPTDEALHLSDATMWKPDVDLLHKYLLYYGCSIRNIFSYCFSK